MQKANCQLPMKSILTLPLALVFLATNCVAVSASAIESAAERLDRVFEDYWEASLELDPVRATFIGDHRFNDRYTVDISPAHIAATRQLLEESLAAVEAVPPEALDAQRRLSRTLFLRQMRHRLDGYRFPNELLPINQFRSDANSFAILGSGSSAQPFATVEDYENFLKRMDGFIAWVDQAIVNMRAGIEAGVVQPALLMERTIPQLDAHVVKDAQESVFYRPVAEFPGSVPETEQERLRGAYEAAITGKLVPAYARLRDFIRNEYLPAGRESYGIYALPDGEEWYAVPDSAAHHDGHVAEEIHQIGLDEVARIHGEMNWPIMDQVGFEGDLKDFFEYLNSDDPKFYYDEPRAILMPRGIIGRCPSRSRADAAAVQRIPEDGLTRFARSSRSARNRRAKGSYRRSHAGRLAARRIYYVNTYDIPRRGRSWAMRGAVPARSQCRVITSRSRSSSRSRTCRGSAASAA
jgi:uncharacterized protein (DUF885 family)